MTRLMMLILAASSLTLAQERERGFAQPDVEKHREQFRRVVREFESSAEYREQRNAMERILSEARNSAAQVQMREAIRQAETDLAIQSRKSAFEWMIREAAASFERLDHQNRLRRDMEAQSSRQ